MKKNIWVRLLVLIVGLAIMAFGSALSDSANLGMAPWDVLNDGFANLMGKVFRAVISDEATAESVCARFATVGRASIFLGLVILAIDVFMHEKVGIGTIVNILTVGLMWDAFMKILPDFSGAAMFDSFALRLIMCILSVIPSSFGMFMYMSSALGAGPRDTLLVGVTKRSRRLSVGVIRILIEGSALIVGFLLGGTVNVGTIILVFLSGPVMEVIFKLFKYDVKVVKNETIGETIKNNFCRKAK